MSLIDSLKTLLGSAVAYKIKTQFFHWNIEGPDFVQYHNFLNDLYTSIEEDIDTIAEHIRTLNVYAPGSLKRFSELSVIKDQEDIPPAIGIFSMLKADTATYIGLLYDCHEQAEAEKKFGIINFLESLIDKYEKTQWMLNSINKNK